MRELVWLSEGRQRDEWQRTAAYMALIANCNKSEKIRAFTPADFNPFERQEQKLVDPENVKMDLERLRNQLGGKVHKVKAKGKNA